VIENRDPNLALNTDIFDPDKKVRLTWLSSIWTVLSSLQDPPQKSY
jgi:hypothetical protein